VGGQQPGEQPSARPKLVETLPFGGRSSASTRASITRSPPGRRPPEDREETPTAAKRKIARTAVGEEPDVLPAHLAEHREPGKLGPDTITESTEVGTSSRTIARHQAWATASAPIPAASWRGMRTRADAAARKRSGTVGTR